MSWSTFEVSLSPHPGEHFPASCHLPSPQSIAPHFHILHCFMQAETPFYVKWCWHSCSTPCFPFQHCSVIEGDPTHMVLLAKDPTCKVATSIACLCLEFMNSPSEVWTWVAPRWLCTLGRNWVMTQRTLHLCSPTPLTCHHLLPSAFLLCSSQHPPPTYPIEFPGSNPIMCKISFIFEVDCVWAPSLGPLHIYETPKIGFSSWEQHWTSKQIQ